MKVTFGKRYPSSETAWRTFMSASFARVELHSKTIFLVLTVLAGTFALTQTALADSFNFSFSGGGITASGIIYVSATGTPGTDTITGITGFFSDTNASANFSGAITGLEPVGPFSDDPPFPNPGNPAAAFSYDNLFYPGGNSPDVCAGYPFDGGVFDIYGMLFDVAGGYTVDVWSNGVVPGVGLQYEVSDALGSTLLEPDNEGEAVPISLSTSPVPEPGSLFLLGTGMLGLAVVLMRKNKLHLKVKAFSQLA